MHRIFLVLAILIIMLKMCSAEGIYNHSYYGHTCYGTSNCSTVEEIPEDEEPQTNTGSGGGGGGGSSRAVEVQLSPDWITYDYSYQDFRKFSSIIQDLKSNERVKISIDGKEYYIGLQEYNDGESQWIVSPIDEIYRFSSVPLNTLLNIPGLAQKIGFMIESDLDGLRLTLTPNPIYLLDVNFLLDSAKISAYRNILTISTFQNFGTEDTPINLIYRIYNSSGYLILEDPDEFTLYTEERLEKVFSSVIYPSGNYSIGLTVEYGNVTENFVQDFEILPFPKTLYYEIIFFVSVLPLLFFLARNEKIAAFFTNHFLKYFEPARNSD